MAGQPGLAGSQFPSEDALIRRMQDMEKAVQQLAAANPFAPMGMTPNANGFDVTGNENVSGNLTVSGTMTASNASITGTLYQSNSWGYLYTGGQLGTTGAPSLVFAKAGSSYAAIGMGLVQASDGVDTMFINGPHATSAPFVSLRADQTFTLQSNSDSGATAGPGVQSTQGSSGTLKLYGGAANGSVNLNVYGTGKVQVNGNFAVSGSKAFIMDHPLHPDTMELMHAATESPVNGVEYWGTVTLDALGEATATLPGYFEALTKTTGRNIQLTPIGRTATQISADRIVDGAFTIYGAPGQEVDWLVKAERQRIVGGYDELAFPPEQDKLIIGPRLPSTSGTGE